MKYRSLLAPPLAIVLTLAACSSSSGNSTDGSSGGDKSASGGIGGGLGHGGGSSSGGSLPNGTNSSGGAAPTGGTPALATGGTSVGNSNSGGMKSTGGTTSTGGALANTGGRAAGGTSATGGSSNVGGVQSGGTVSAGGTRSTGGSKSTGGTSSSGGSRNTGGTQATGGSGPAGGAGGGAGESSAYSPCAASPCKVLPFGDSITHGLQSTDSGGYRSQLFKLVVAGGQTLTFLGSQSSGPASVQGATFPKNHEGHDGFTVDSGYSTYGTAGISSLMPSPAFSTIPDIVLLHIGTNDITSTGSASTSVSTRLDGLLTKIVGIAPKALIVVAQIIPVGYTSADLTSYNSKIPGIIQSHASQGQHIIGVDMGQMPKSDLASDNVHPNDAGYTYMANIWYTAIKGYLR